MRIAQIAPLAERVPPKKYGGTERVVHVLTEELVRRGHEVTLFASGDSQTSGKLSSIFPLSLREDKQKDIYGINKHTLLNLGHAYSRQDEFDIIHDHTGEISLPIANICNTPTVFTLHGPLMPESRRMMQILRKPNLVTISKAQGKYHTNINIVGTVYNGLNMEEFPFSESPDDYLLYVGRISMEKGVHHAIETANELGKKLIIAAKLEPTDVPYFREYVEPFLSRRIVWVGEVDEEQRNKFMSKALCFLHPVTWPEPFGLTLIEAMACGCPVVAFCKGSIPEIIQDGITGHVVADVAEMIETVANIDKIDRHTCRSYALETFNGRRMAEGYEKIYIKILNGKRSQ